MKVKKYTFIIILLFCVITLPILIFLGDDSALIRNLIVINIILLILNFIYTFFGLSLLITYSIYAIIIGITLLFLPESFHFAFITLSSLLVILNPLSSFERYLAKKLDKIDQAISVEYFIKRSEFQKYRKSLNEAFHKPQVVKLYSNKQYKYARQITTLLFLFLSVYLFVMFLDGIVINFEDFSATKFFYLYFDFILVIELYLIIKKGFTTTFKILAYASIVPIVYYLYAYTIDDLIKYVLLITIISIFISLFILDYSLSFKRIVYQAVNYYDQDLRAEVFANSAFERVVTNKSYNNLVVFSFDYSKKDFSKNFKQIFEFSNFHNIMISSYTISNDSIKLYTYFSSANERQLKVFKVKLEYFCKSEVNYSIIYDKNKNLFDKVFLKNPEYSVAKALNFASLAKELLFETPLLIKLRIKSDLQYNDLIAIFLNYQVNYIEDNIFDVCFSTYNVNYMIEQKIRNTFIIFLLNKIEYLDIFAYNIDSVVL